MSRFYPVSFGHVYVLFIFSSSFILFFIAATCLTVIIMVDWKSALCGNETDVLSLADGKH